MSLYNMTEANAETEEESKVLGVSDGIFMALWCDLGLKSDSASKWANGRY